MLSHARKLTLSVQAMFLNRESKIVLYIYIYLYTTNPCIIKQQIHYNINQKSVTLSHWMQDLYCTRKKGQNGQWGILKTPNDELLLCFCRVEKRLSAPSESYTAQEALCQSVCQVYEVTMHIFPICNQGLTLTAT